METVRILLQIVIALGILNVWCLRLNQPTEYRGGDAKNMEEEFRVYGLSKVVMVSTGAAKVLLALLLLYGLWDPSVVPFASGGMALLMLIAVTMHSKVRDPLRKAVPAFLMMLMSIVVLMSGRPVPLS